MLIYRIKHTHHNTLVLHFGIGLLGEAIYKKIMVKSLYSNVTCEEISFSWEAVETYDNQVNLVLDEASKGFEDVSELILLWSAGKAGFNASKEEVDKQYLQYTRVLNALAKSIKNRYNTSKFILLSSAGGLFEGQIAVNKKNEPKPMRPYGELKLKEENYILNNALFDTVEIYRISSVYSIRAGNNRKGLVQVLMENGTQNKVNYIFGNESTLRDYVLDDDIGDYIADIIYHKKRNKTINFLVDTKPSSIFEIRKVIEKILKKPLFIVYSPVKTNALNITFSNSIKAKGFKTSSLISNLQLLYKELIKR